MAVKAPSPDQGSPRQTISITAESSTGEHWSRSGVGKLWSRGPLPVFVNKVLLEHSHAHLLKLLSQHNGRVDELSSCDTVKPAKLKLFVSGLLRKSSLNPNLDNSNN